MSIVYGALTIWEHGDDENRQRSSACVEHAHLNVLPGNYALRANRTATEESNYEDIGSWMLDAQRWQGRPYLLSGWHGDGFSVIEDHIKISQYYRRQIAEQLGRPDEWDYAACPSYEYIRQTIADLNEVFGESREHPDESS